VIFIDFLSGCRGAGVPTWNIVRRDFGRVQGNAPDSEVNGLTGIFIERVPAVGFFAATFHKFVQRRTTGDDPMLRRFFIEPFDKVAQQINGPWRRD
jgi:hypothetical protein